MITSYKPESIQESAHERTIRLLADDALTLAPRFTELRSAVWQVLRNRGIQEVERISIHREVMAELRKRSKVVDHARRMKQAKIAELSTTQVAEQTANMMADAYAHQIRQPHDTWNIDAEEEARRSA